ncbi:MAG: hypothetical protein HC858_11160 [Brachymonas sp.]|nr:hypothetical protein [Brachymonas sp.]
MKQAQKINRRQASSALAGIAAGGISALAACSTEQRAATAPTARVEHAAFQPLTRIAYGSCADQTAINRCGRQSSQTALT